MVGVPLFFRWVLQGRRSGRPSPICWRCNSRMNQGREDEGEEHRGDGGRDGPERDVPEDVEEPEPRGVVPEREEELVERSGGLLPALQP